MGSIWRNEDNSRIILSNCFPLSYFFPTNPFCEAVLAGKKDIWEWIKEEQMPGDCNPEFGGGISGDCIDLGWFYD
jgi:hypothetical protein